MRTAQMKLRSWLLVVWLIGLQLIAPFVHAHLEADAVEHASVMHLHTAASSAHDHQHAAPAWENPHGPHQVVSVAEGMREQFDFSALADLLPSSPFSLLPVLLVCLCLLSLQRTSLAPPTKRLLFAQPQAPPSLY